MTDGHKVEGCQGRWIDAGTLHDPLKQLCSGCRAIRQKSHDDDDPAEGDALTKSERRHLRGLARLRADMGDDKHRPDPVHQDEDGFWFWDEAWAERVGPYETEAACRQALDEYIDTMGIESVLQKPIVEQRQELLFPAVAVAVLVTLLFAASVVIAWLLARDSRAASAARTQAEYMDAIARDCERRGGVFDAVIVGDTVSWSCSPSDPSDDGI